MGTGNLLGKPNKLRGIGGVTCDGLASRPGRVEILLALCYGNQHKLRQHEPVLAPRLHFTSSLRTIIPKDGKNGQNRRCRQLKRQLTQFPFSKWEIVWL